MKQESRKTMLGEPNTEQFEVVTSVNESEVHRMKIHDPFVRTTTQIKGFKAAWLCLTKGLRVTTQVNGTHGAMQMVMMLDPHRMRQISHIQPSNEFPTTNKQSAADTAATTEERVGQHANAIS